MVPIAIVGGGITGLCTALALKKLGIESTVYEQSALLKEVGAGIWLQPNAMKVLNWLGVGDMMREAGATLRKVEIVNPDLTPIQRFKAMDEEQQGGQIIAIHRGRLQQILYNQVVDRVQLGHRYQSHTFADRKVQIHFENEMIEADLMLGADGIHSDVRAQLFPEAETRNSGQICFRGIGHLALSADLLNTGRESWGVRKRFGFSNISDNEVYWFAVFNQELVQGEMSKQAIMKMFDEFHPEVSKIIEATENIHRAKLEDLKRMPRWSSGHCCLIGDAAHATTPNMGQGAGQGIEDAYYLANEIAKNGRRPKAFDSFEKKRRKKVDYIVNNSWRFGKMAHNPSAQSIFKVMAKMIPANIAQKQMKKIYSVEGL